MNGDNLVVRFYVILVKVKSKFGGENCWKVWCEILNIFWVNEVEFLM